MNVVIPRPSPDGEMGPGVGKVGLLSISFVFVRDDFWKWSHIYFISWELFHCPPIFIGTCFIIIGNINIFCVGILGVRGHRKCYESSTRTEWKKIWGK